MTCLTEVHGKVKVLQDKDLNRALSVPSHNYPLLVWTSRAYQVSVLRVVGVGVHGYTPISATL